jgi:hypothetical protein
MNATGVLIETLAAQAAPVRRLRPPLWRAAAWLVFALVVLAGFVVWHGLPEDLAGRFADARFCLCLAGALGTGVLATLAAFQASLPDRAWAWRLLPLPAAALWAATVAQECLTDWVRVGPDGFAAGHTVTCFLLVLACSVPLSGALLLMLRPTARLAPRAPAALAGLAVAGLCAATLAVTHDAEASAVVLLWNAGTAAVVLAAEAVAARRMWR